VPAIGGDGAGGRVLDGRCCLGGATPRGPATARTARSRRSGSAFDKTSAAGPAACAAQIRPPTSTPRLPPDCPTSPGTCGRPLWPAASKRCVSATKATKGGREGTSVASVASVASASGFRMRSRYLPMAVWPMQKLQPILRPPDRRSAASPASLALSSPAAREQPQSGRCGDARTDPESRSGSCRQGRAAAPA
jgi:hypothetical protein